MTQDLLKMVTEQKSLQLRPRYTFKKQLINIEGNQKF